MLETTPKSLVLIASVKVTGTKKLVTMLRTRAKDRRDDWTNGETEILKVVVGLRGSNGIWTKAWRKLDRTLRGWLGKQTRPVQRPWDSSCDCSGAARLRDSSGRGEEDWLQESKAGEGTRHGPFPWRGPSPWPDELELPHWGNGKLRRHIAQNQFTAWLTYLKDVLKTVCKTEGRHKLEQNLGCGEHGTWCMSWLRKSFQEACKSVRSRLVLCWQTRKQQAWWETPELDLKVLFEMCVAHSHENVRMAPEVG